MCSWRALGRAAALFSVSMLAWGCVALAGEAPPEVHLDDPADLLRIAGPTGVVGYLAYVVGKNNGIPISVTIQVRPEDRELLRRVLEVLTRTLEVRDKPPDG